MENNHEDPEQATNQAFTMVFAIFAVGWVFGYSSGFISAGVF